MDEQKNYGPKKQTQKEKGNNRSVLINEKKKKAEKIWLMKGGI